MPTKRSRVHPKYKTQYRVSNWSDYDQALVQRGNITLWVTQDAIDNWKAKPTKRRGGQPKYSDLAIETALTLRLLLHLPLGQADRLGAERGHPGRNRRRGHGRSDPRRGAR